MDITRKKSEKRIERKKNENRGSRSEKTFKKSFTFTTKSKLNTILGLSSVLLGTVGAMYYMKKHLYNKINVVVNINSIPQAIGFLLNQTVEKIYNKFNLSGKEKYIDNNHTKDWQKQETVGNNDENTPVTHLDVLEKEIKYDPNYKGSWDGNSFLTLFFIKEYLIKKWNNACTITSLSGILFDEDKKIIEIIDNNGSVKKINITYLSFLFTEFDIQCNKRFFIIPIGIIKRKIGHANMLIFDTKKRIIEHFEPYGSKYYKNEKMFTIDVLNDSIRRANLQYIPPQLSCPYIGPQDYKCPEIMNIQTSGFCLLWSLWYADLRLKYTEEHPESLVRRHTPKDKDFCKFIQSFAMFILEFSKKYDFTVNSQGFILEYFKKN